MEEDYKHERSTGLQATKTAPNSRGRNNNYVVQIDRIRVTAYCRVSTDGDEQLGSFESQKLYYEEKIRKNKEWAMAGIFADEAITGTKIDKREGFQEIFDRIVFENIVEKVIVGGYDAEGNPTPYKLIFVLKCNQTLKVENTLGIGDG